MFLRVRIPLGGGAALGAVNKPQSAFLATYKTGTDVGSIHLYQCGRHSLAATSFKENPLALRLSIAISSGV